MARWLTAEEALAILAVKPQTLYANVSRGRIRSRPAADGSRLRLYDAADVARMADRARGPQRSTAVARETMRWGEPVLESGITTIAKERLWYRGQDAVTLSDQGTAETAAEILWGAQPVAFGCGRADGPGSRGAAFRMLAERAAVDPPLWGRAAPALHTEAAEVIGALAAALLGSASEEPLHARVAAAWKVPMAGEGIRRMLVLLADHELNASTFAVRVAASTGASLSASLLAGIATLTGPAHGGAAVGVRALIGRAALRGPDEAIRECLEEGRPVPGFGHRLYPQGDVRAAVFADAGWPPELRDLADAAERLTGERPNVDFALCSLEIARTLPNDAAFTLFALARSIGWTAHAIEQAATRKLIRPRAIYVGAPPSE